MPIAFDQLLAQKSMGKLLRDALRPEEARELAFRLTILSIPAGKVSTYSGVAAAAGYPRCHSAVARLLRMNSADHLPRHRVLGVGGEIRVRGPAAEEQLSKLLAEGVGFKGRKVDMKRFEYFIDDAASSS